MELSLKDLLAKIPVREVVGSSDKVINRVVGIGSEESKIGDLTWSSDANIDTIYGIENAIIICSDKLARGNVNNSCSYLIVDNPRLYFLKVLKEFFVTHKPPVVSPGSTIDPAVKLGKDVRIESGVVIEANCEIGDYTSIDSNTVIKEWTIIGNNVKIGANNTIGGVGFGYERGDDGMYEAIPHIGNVIIMDGVEIGNNTTIDRAVLGSTIIRENVKIDNLVHIAHGVDIGENSLIIANAMVAGSVVIGKNVWVAPSSSILNKKKIEDNAVIGMGAVVLKNVSEKQTVVGNPAKDILLR